MISPVRDNEKVLATLKRVGDSIITIAGCKIHIPVRYETVGLATVGAETRIYGFFHLFLLDGSYGAVVNKCSMMKVNPDEIQTVKIGEESYYEMLFEAGSVVIENVKVFRDDLIISKIFKEFVNKGKLPYWTEYSDATGLFRTAQSHANAYLGTYEGLAIPISIIARDPNDVSRYYREILTDNKPKPKPLFVPAASVRHSSTRTVSKLNGSHFEDEGLVSAINNPTETADLIDYILRY